MDRQELKLVFETGEVTLFEWVPSRIVIKGVVSKEVLKAIKELLPKGKIVIEKSFEGKERIFKSHSSNRVADYKISLETGDAELKYSIYQQLLTDMMKDQLEWLKNINHRRRITEQNALQSVRMAEQANKLAVLI
jgi:hypothetical protein